MLASQSPRLRELDGLIEHSTHLREGAVLVSDPAILGGKPRIRGTRISVQHVLDVLASGPTREEFLAAFPHVGSDGFARELAWEEKRSA